MPYLNVVEVESALDAAALGYPALCSLITLPNATCDGRTSHAVRIRGGPRVHRHGVLLIGGVHAREWGSSDILVSFIDGLLAAYSSNTGVTYGGRSFTKKQVQDLIENIDLFVFPDVNPDGKSYSQTTYAMWRKNRCPVAGTTAIGTDINRNYDFLWDFRAKFVAGAAISANDDPVNDPAMVFHGTAPFSEPETRNVRFLLDSLSQIRLLIDVHSYSQLLLYPWGDDYNQSTDPSRNFRNAAWDGLRDIYGTAYAEYVHAADEGRWVAFCNRMNTSLTAVRGKVYTIGSSFATLYPTCGTSFCYAFSRHLVDSAKGKVDGLLIEWGTTFQPAYDTEMVEVIKDISAALFEACLATDEIPRLQVTPTAVAYGYTQIGSPKTATVTLRNDGVRTAAIAGVGIETGPDAARFTPVLSGGANIPAGAQRTVQVTFAPDAVRAFAATLLMTVKEPSVSWSDVMRVPLTGTACSVEAGDCIAPVFEKMNFLQFLLFLIIAVVVIVLLLLFIWVPGVACQIKKLQYRISNWSKGNSDPCKTI